jgi:hypothetical protein
MVVLMGKEEAWKIEAREEQDERIKMERMKKHNRGKDKRLESSTFMIRV